MPTKSTVKWASLRNSTRWSFKAGKAAVTIVYSKLLKIASQQRHSFTERIFFQRTSCIQGCSCLDRLVQSSPRSEHEVSILKVCSKGFFPTPGICRLPVWPCVRGLALRTPGPGLQLWSHSGAPPSARRCTDLTFVRLWGAERLGGGVNGLSRSSPKTAAGRSPSPSQGA